MPNRPAALAPHAFTLRQLQYLVAIADAGSFRAAAQACGVSQPSLSAQVAEVERQLGVRVFERDRRSLLTTPAGATLLAAARAVLLAADQVTSIGRGLGDPLAATLRLGVIPTIAPYLLPRLVPLLRRRHPKLTALWHEEKTDVLVSLLGEGRLEAALVALEAPLGDLQQAPLGKDPFLLCVPAGHWLAGGGHRPHTDVLASEKLLLLDEGHCLREQALSVCSRLHTEEAGFRATSLPTLVQMVASRAGITLLPRLAAAVEVERADIVVRAFRPPEPARTLGLVWRRGSSITEALTRLATTVRRAIASAPPPSPAGAARR